MSTSGASSTPRRTGCARAWRRGSLRPPPRLRAVIVNAVDAINGETVEEIVGSSDGNATAEFMPLANGAHPRRRRRSGCWSPTRRRRRTQGDRAGRRARTPSSRTRTAPAPGCAGTRSKISSRASPGPGITCSTDQGRDHLRRRAEGLRHRPGATTVGLRIPDGRRRRGNVGAQHADGAEAEPSPSSRESTTRSASGGADAGEHRRGEGRGTYAIKNRDRAITAEDYESLALAASRRVARAKCVQGPRTGSIVAAPGPQGRARRRRCPRAAFPRPDRPGRELHRQAPSDHRPGERRQAEAAAGLAGADHLAEGGRHRRPGEGGHEGEGEAAPEPAAGRSQGRGAGPSAARWARPTSTRWSKAWRASTGSRIWRLSTRAAACGWRCSSSPRTSCRS